MAPIKINLAKAERRLLEEGEYITRIDKVEFVPKKPNNLAATLHVEVVTEDNGDESIDGVRLYRDMSFSDQSLWSIKEFIEAAVGKIEHEYTSEDDADVEIDEEELIGQMVGVAVWVDDQYNPNRPSNKIDAWLAVDDVGADDGEEEDEPESEPVTTTRRSRARVEEPEPEMAPA